MPTKTKTSAGECNASALEIATLAVEFLPKIELPPDWQRESPTTLSDAVGKPTGNPFPENPSYIYPEYWRTSWEVVCEEAVKRAKTLLDAAAGRTRATVLAYDAADANARAQLDRMEEEDARLRKKFDKLAGNRKSLPVAEVLQFCLPRAKSANVRMQYFRDYLKECARQYNLSHAIDEKPVIADQTERTVYRREFPVFVRGFTAAYKVHGEAWRKAFARKAGSDGGTETQRQRRESESEVGPATALSIQDVARLNKAAKKRNAAKPRKK